MDIDQLHAHERVICLEDAANIQPLLMHFLDGSPWPGTSQPPKELTACQDGGLLALEAGCA